MGRPGVLVPMALMGALLGTPSGAASQAAPLVVEVRGGGVLPTGAFRRGSGPGEGTDAGASFGVEIAMSGSGRRTTYVGFSQHRFGCRAAGCPRDGSYVATGFNAGIRLNLSTRGSVIPWLRVGGLTTRVETRDLPAPDAGVTSLGFGGEVGFGVYIGATRSVALNPGVRYAGVRTRLPGGALLDMRYLVADLALALAF